MKSDMEGRKVKSVEFGERKTILELQQSHLVSAAAQGDRKDRHVPGDLRGAPELIGKKPEDELPAE